MERIEKLRLQLEEAERKEAEKAEKKAEVERERKQRKVDALNKRIASLNEQQERVDQLLSEAIEELQNLHDEDPSFAQVKLDVVSDDDADASNIA
jgi:chromosome segregation ATPase